LYRIEEAVAELIVDHWTTKGKPIKAGDRALIWKAKGTQSNRGLVALADITGDPVVTGDEANPYWIDPSAASAAEERVTVRYLRTPRLPMWLTDDNRAVLGDLSVARGQGTLFYVSPEQWKAVIEAVGGWQDSSPDAEFLDSQVRNSGTSPRGQGRLADPAARIAIDRYAMARAIEHFSSRWPVVQDVSRFACYDLLCRNGAEELRVEVKGTTTHGEAVLITHNELENAKKHFPNVALFVMSEIEIDRSETEPRATGGTERVLHPWDISTCQVTPVTLDCCLPPPGKGDAC
jgi:hypothetical protein